MTCGISNQCAIADICHWEKPQNPDMFDFPAQIAIDELESRHETYDELIDVWQQIDDLVVGGFQLERKKSDYIVKRPGEDQGLYELRLKKFAYTPVLGSALRDYTTRITNAPFHVAGCDGQQWDDFRGKTDGKRRDERSLLNKIFRTQLCYGRAWAFVDRPMMPVAPLNRLQEEMLGSRPYVVLYEPLNVINWGFKLDSDDVLFVKIRQLIPETSPFSEPKLRCVWTIIDDAAIARYEAYVVIDQHGRITDAKPINNPNQNRSITKTIGDVQIPISIGYPVAHGRGKCPVVHLPIEPELWSCNIAYLKAKQHLQIENAWTDTATIAGYVQRVFTPRDPVPDGDPNISFSEPDAELQQIKSSNAHILVGKDFKFAEANGSSLQVISEFVLDKIEHQIKAIVNLGNVSAAKGAIEQSGVSKSIDYNMLNETMKTYGDVLCEGYEEILKQVAIALGIRDRTALEEIKVSGLDSFDVDNLGSMIEQSLNVQKIEANLSPTARRLWWVKLAETMHGSTDAETKQLIRDEFDQMDFTQASTQSQPVGDPSVPAIG